MILHILWQLYRISLRDKKMLWPLLLFLSILFHGQKWLNIAGGRFKGFFFYWWEGQVHRLEQAWEKFDRAVTIPFRFLLRFGRCWFADGLGFFGGQGARFEFLKQTHILTLSQRFILWMQHSSYHVHLRFPLVFNVMVRYELVGLTFVYINLIIFRLFFFFWN